MNNWPKQVPQFQRQKIINFIQDFDQYIKENHKGSQQQDQYVFNQWQCLKKLIYQSPAEIQKHTQYVEKMTDQPQWAFFRSQRQSGKQKTLDIPTTPGRLKRKKSSQQLVFELDKTKLQQYAHDTIMLIKKNNKQMLKL